MSDVKLNDHLSLIKVEGSDPYIMVVDVPSDLVELVSLDNERVEKFMVSKGYVKRTCYFKFGDT